MPTDSTENLTSPQLAACRMLTASSDTDMFDKTGEWCAVQDRETIYVFNTDKAVAYGDVQYLARDHELLGWVHIDALKPDKSTIH